MSSQPKTHLSPQQYLEIERAADEKSEYYAGEMFAMGGASRRRNLIVGNLVGELRQQLKDRPCEVYPSDMRVKVDASGLYTYPDVTVVCGQAQFEDEQTDTLLNPTVLFEVLSKSSEAYDRGAKFAQYRKLDSLQEYLLVSQDKPLVEHFQRTDDDQWLLSEADDLQGSLSLPAIACTLSLSEVYAKVDWQESE